jgi:hypothetical protein
MRSNAELPPGDAKIKSWHDGWGGLGHDDWGRDVSFSGCDDQFLGV